MKLTNIGLDYFDGTDELQVYVEVVTDEGTKVHRKLSDLLEDNSVTATAQALKDIGEKRLK